MKTVKDYEYSFNHVKERLKERYDLNIEKHDYDTMNNGVRESRNPKKAFSVDNNGDQEVYLYIFDVYPPKKILVVWSNSKDRITTVLPNKI